MQEMNSNCGRAEDLVAYLYGEAAPAEAQDFEGHARQCASCREELAAFGAVREAIGEWRLQSLPSPEPLAVTSAHAAAGNETYRRRRSALSALREFFTLSPAWMRAGVAAAGLIFCALTFIAVAYFTERPEVIVLEAQTPSGGGKPAEIMVEPIETVTKQDAKTDRSQALSVAANGTRPPAQPRRRTAGRRQYAKVRGRALPRQTSERPMELASADDYLPFTAYGDEDELPSLSDLVNEEN